MPEPVGGIRSDDRAVTEALSRLYGWSRKHGGRALWDVGDHLVRATRDRFREERAPDGTPWEVTVRKRHNPSARILYRTGRLERSFRRWVDQRAGSVEVRSNLRYAYIQHHGSKDLRQARRRVPRGATAEERRRIVRQRAIDRNVRAKRGPVVLPARPILGVGADDGRELVDIIRRRALRLWR